MKREPLTGAQIEALAAGSPLPHNGLDMEEAMTSMAQEIERLRALKYAIVNALAARQVFNNSPSDNALHFAEHAESVLRELLKARPL